MGPMNPEPGTSTLQSISNQHRLSEQPEDLQSIHTPNDDPQDDDEEDGKKFFKKLLLALDKPVSEPP